MYKFYKYHGAGNDFFIADNRSGRYTLSADQIRRLCDRHTGFGADGVMLLENSDSGVFRMVYYNPDGSTGMMCGNGGRCIVSFAADLGLVTPGERFSFEAPDGLHQAEILPAPPVAEPVSPVAEPAPSAVSPASPVAEPVEATSSQTTEFLRQPDQPERTVRLKMKDVTESEYFLKGGISFFDTGARHIVKFVKGLNEYPVRAEGPVLRRNRRFAPAGVNVNFVEPTSVDGVRILNIRTFEKGVEDETLACGTGIVAAALAAFSQGFIGGLRPDGRVSVVVRAAIASLTVDFFPGINGSRFTASDIWLTGPSDFVGTVEIML